jgi:diaminohydroxyphosphoribosylaminopyrimidine deaminase/5-amino-6-(5-phosphoribosylamino)uracil reductase
MKRAIELASNARGKTHPNPCVGCVIVESNGTIVGEGWHVKAGEDHAEVMALKLAGAKANGATAYVSLEPCNHYGKTPPCTLALLKYAHYFILKVSMFRLLLYTLIYRHGIKRVVTGMVDPDPRVSGNGLKYLEENGVNIQLGPEEKACKDINKVNSSSSANKTSNGLLDQ